MAPKPTYEELEQRIRLLEAESSKRKKAEEALIAAKDLAEKLIQTANTIIVGLDLQGDLTIFNRAAEEITGYTRAEVEGKNWFEVLAPKDRYPEVWEEFNRLLEGGLPEKYENPILTKSGEERYIIWRNNLIVEKGSVIGTISYGMDITERKKMEESLRHSREQFRSLIESAPEAIVVQSGGRFLYLNSAMLDLLGASRSDEVVGYELMERMAPEYRDAISERIRYQLETGKPAPLMEQEYLRIDGSRVPVETTAVAIRFEGKDAHLVFVRDITKRKLADAALRQSEERFRDLFDNSLDMICIHDLEGKIISINSAGAAMFGYAVDELIGKDMRNYMVPSFRDDFDNVYMANIRKHGHVKGTTSIQLHKGGRRILEYNNTLRIEPGRSPIIRGVARDITERWKTEKALRENEFKYRSLFENAMEGIYQSTPEGRFLSVNPAMARIYGYDSPEEMVNSVNDIPTQIFITPQDRAESVRILEADGVLPHFEVKHRKKDGTIIWLTLHSRAVRDNSGKIIYIEGMAVDITDRKQAEDALQRSERRLADVIEFLPDATLAIDNEKKVIVWNKAIEKMTGVKAEDMIGKGDHEYAIPFYGERRPQLMDLIWEDVQGVVEKYSQVHREGESLSAESFCNALYGGLGAHVYAKVSPFHDQEGNVIGAIESIRDIEKQKQAEEALRDSEEKYRNIFENAAEGIFQSTPEGKFLSVNPAMALMCGYSSPEEMILSITDIASQFYVYPEEREIFMRNLEDHGFDMNFEHQVYRKDGSVLWISTNSRAVRDNSGKILYYEGTHEDITERKHAEEELKESRRRLSDIIEFFPDATLVVDKDEKVIAWNRAIESMTGIKKEGMLGKGDKEYAIPFYGDRRPILIDLALHPDREMEKKYTAVQRIGDILFGESYTPNLPPGDRHLSATASVLRDSKGEIIAAIECIRDNTERKKLEEQLNRAEKMEGLGRLAGGVAHDLNNVLGVMVGYSELLTEKLPENSPLRKYADNILKSSVRGAAIIQDLLTLARRGVSGSEIVNINDVIFEYLRTPEFEKMKSFHPNVKIWTELDDDLLNIKGSPVHLGKTLMNLVSNAAEAITNHGEITIRTESRYLDQHIHGYDSIKDGDYVVLTVSDTGKGISSQDIGKIFEPFYTKKVMGKSGTGLGLSIVWGTVKDHDGYIDVQSGEGIGSTFTIYFPVTREEASTAKEAIPLENYMGKGESILVVDDVEAQRELAVSMLERLGYRVDAVAGGEEAIEYLKKKKVDLVVLDMILDPGIDGLETYEKVLEAVPAQKAILVSGFSESDRVKKAQEIGAGAFVRKPYVLEKIGLAVRRELDR
jgi:PAS domain S-box-containing protein